MVSMGGEHQSLRYCRLYNRLNNLCSPFLFLHSVNKYHAQRTEVDGVWFASQKEARYYQDLLLAKRSGELLYFLRQVPIHIIGGIKYVCDFVEFWRNGEVRYTDAKGFRTPVYKIKKKQVEALYPIKILEY